MLYNSDNGQVPWMLKTMWWWPSWSRDDKSLGIYYLVDHPAVAILYKSRALHSCRVAADVVIEMIPIWSFTQIFIYIFVIYSNFVYIYIGHLLKFCLQNCAVYLHLKSDLRMICVSFTQLLWSPTRIN